MPTGRLYYAKVTKKDFAIDSLIIRLKICILRPPTLY